MSMKYVLNTLLVKNRNVKAATQGFVEPLDNMVIVNSQTVHILTDRMKEAQKLKV